MTIQSAQSSHSEAIATLIMQAMTEDCCRYYAGMYYRYEDFHRMLSTLVSRIDSQYSYLNTLVAINENQEVCGICVGYDGALLHTLRPAFVNAIANTFRHHLPSIDDETQAGEYYIDSLAVLPHYRGQGIATALLEEACHRARRMQQPALGLLVDTANPRAQSLYQHLGFQEVGPATWGGHSMIHMQRPISSDLDL